jgi:predicted N-acetyltransferase YhbS
LTELPPEVIHKLPRYPSVPAVLMGWMARDEKFKGQQLGQLLLADAIQRLAAAPMGLYAISIAVKNTAND